MRSVLLLTLAGCQASPAEPTPPGVELRDRDGTVVVRVTPTAGGCTIEAPVRTATVAGDLTSSGSWRIAPGPRGRELYGPGGLLARILDEPDHLSVIDPLGVP